MSRDAPASLLAGGSRDRLTSKQPASPASCTPTRPRAPRPSSAELWRVYHVPLSQHAPASAWAGVVYKSTRGGGLESYQVSKCVKTGSPGEGMDASASAVLLLHQLFLISRSVVSDSL